MLVAGALGAQNKTTVLVAGVADAETGQPLEGAEVLLVELHRLARANQMGEARLDGIPQGRHLVRVRKLGYAPSEIHLEFSGDTTGAVFRLPRSVTSLTEVKVEADAAPPIMGDVERRMRRGIGRFLAAEELDKERDRDIGILAAMRFPGLQLKTNSYGTQYLSSLRGAAPCPLQVYWDNMALAPGDDLWMVRTWDLAAVEYYTPSQVPVEYRSRPHGCGVLMLWSKWF